MFLFPAASFGLWLQATIFVCASISYVSPVDPVSLQGLFSSPEILQNFSDSPSHRIFGHMHKALNIDKK
jgi:hypothetical protein